MADAKAGTTRTGGDNSHMAHDIIKISGIIVSWTIPILCLYILFRYM